MGYSRPDLRKKIGEKIRNARIQSKLSLEALSKKTGFSVSMLSALELGERRLSIDALYILAEALNVSTADLLADDDKTDNNNSDNIDKKKSKIIDKQFENLGEEWEKYNRKDEAVVLLREFRNLTPDEIQMLIKTIKTLKDN